MLFVHVAPATGRFQQLRYQSQNEHMVKHTSLKTKLNRNDDVSGRGEHVREGTTGIMKFFDTFH